MQKTKRTLLLAVLGIGLALTPVYIFDSGGMQITHLFFAILMFLVIIKEKIKVPKLSLLVLLFFLYSVMVELIYGIINSSVIQLINPIYILYNFLLLTTVSAVVEKYGMSSVKFGLIIAVTIATVSVLATGIDLTNLNGEGRPAGTFNNPNQLGYFSTCIISISYLLHHHKYNNYLETQILVLSAFVLSILSLSKAAMLANTLVLIFLFSPKNLKMLGFFIFLAFPCICYIIYLLLNNGTLEDYLFYQRIFNMMDEGDSSLSERGYFAFLNGNPFQMLFGLGEENVKKFVGHEVHSTFGSVLNNYGFIGITIFVVVYCYWIRILFLAYGWLIAILIMAAPTLYGITHNGLRFTIFWLLIALSYSAAKSTIAEHSKKLVIIKV